MSEAELRAQLEMLRRQMDDVLERLRDMDGSRRAARAENKRDLALVDTRITTHQGRTEKRQDAIEAAILDLARQVGSMNITDAHAAGAAEGAKAVREGLGKLVLGAAAIAASVAGVIATIVALIH